MKASLILVAALAGGALVVACSSSDSTSSGGDASADGASGGHDGSTTGDDAGSGGDGGSGGDASGEDGGACTLVSPYSTKNKGCNDCAQAKCCTEINGCLADTVCNDDYVNCLLACAIDPGDAGDAGVATCEAACDAQYPTGKAEYDTAIGCADQKCQAECQ